MTAKTLNYDLSDLFLTKNQGVNSVDSILSDYQCFENTVPLIAEVTVTNNFSADIDKISVLARKYESNGDLACVANNPGDLGGIS